MVGEEVLGGWGAEQRRKKMKETFWGEGEDEEEFCGYGFTPWSALLAAGLSLRHEGSPQCTCQQASSWHGAHLDPASSC